MQVIMAELSISSTSSDSPNFQSPAPFLQCHQLNDELEHLDLSALGGREHLPGYPRVVLADPVALATFLENELHSSDLESMSPYLWMMSSRSSANVSPLHRQRVKGREIVVSEDPKLHLVWQPHRIYVKPLPQYLLSHTFWTTYLLSQTSPLGSRSRDRLLKAALGYLRTYCYLIQHESDFFLAQDIRLIPDHVTWPGFCAFTSGIASITDASVSPRYEFGELRLGRLNFYAKFVLRKYRFQYVHTSYSTYFARFYGPFLFVFGIVSVMLGAFQVWLQAEPQGGYVVWSIFKTARAFAILVLFFMISLTLLLLSLGLYRFVNEWQHAIRKEVTRRRRNSSTDSNKQSGLGIV